MCSDVNLEFMSRSGRKLKRFRTEVEPDGLDRLVPSDVRFVFVRLVPQACAVCVKRRKVLRRHVLRKILR